MTNAPVYICDYLRTPIGRYGGALAHVRTDNLAAAPIRALLDRNPAVDWEQLGEVTIGCANQAGEDNRNVARMAVLLAGLPESVPALTVNRLCASGMDAVILAARSIQLGAVEIAIAGGVESMSRSPFVMPKSETPFARQAEIYDTTIGWRFVNDAIADKFGIESMPETAENIAEDWGVSRVDQDMFAFNSQNRAANAMASGRLSMEIAPLEVPKTGIEDVVVSRDEHPRETTIEQLGRLKTPFRSGGSVTAGNASGINDGAAALLLASEDAVKAFGLKPLARFEGAASAGVPPRIMGIGPVPATRKLCAALGCEPSDFDLVEINEAFAAQMIAVCRDLGFDPGADHINPNGGAIALGHPLGMTGARLIGTAALELSLKPTTRALCSMCVGVGQGVSVALASV